MHPFGKVFIIDDDEITRFLLITKLEKYGFASQYHTFASAKEALAFLKNTRDNPLELPDLIFLDINMPDMDSWAFLERYENLFFSNIKNIHVCILTSSVFEKDIERANAHPLVDEYLVKPIQNDSLKNLVEKYALER
uniref:Response regulator n=1 Tax=Roseihalotalea indica TaxID=2867963 RepID=A0AA49JHQ7_9BACT|nr:response regulator [Tunicatimonas sp. TK19036]